MAHPSLRLAAARFVLELSTTEELIDAAHEALNDSVYSYSLGELATLREPTEADIHPLFIASLKELEIPMPTLGEAIDAIMCERIGVSAEGAVAPRNGVEELLQLFESFDWPRPMPLEELPEDLRELASFSYRYDEIVGYSDYLAEVNRPEEGVAALKKLDDNCIQFAKQWCRNRWQPHFDTGWLTSTVLALARGIHDEQAYDRLPILADALQDAGCENDDILDHCRRSRTHHRWCWVVDLLLDKG